VKVSSEPAAAVTASPADSQYAGPPARITRRNPGAAVTSAIRGTLVVTAITRSHRLRPLKAQVRSTPDGQLGQMVPALWSDGPGWWP
jgi:hypothetical protein